MISSLAGGWTSSQTLRWRREMKCQLGDEAGGGSGGDEQLLALCLLEQVSVEERLERSHLGLEVLHRPKYDMRA